MDFQSVGGGFVQFGLKMIRSSGAMMKTCTSISTRFWAIRLGDYIEVRSSPEPPKALISTLKKTIKAPITFDLGYHVSNRKVTFTKTFYIGGKVLGVAKYNSLRNRVKLEKNKMIEVNLTVKKAILRKRIG